MRKLLITFCVGMVFSLFPSLCYAAPATTLTFSPATLSKHPGDIFSIDVIMSPGSNMVSFIKLHISFDQTKLATTSANSSCGMSICVNSTLLPQKFAPTYSSGSIIMNMAPSTGTAITTPQTKIATITFKSLAATTGTPITFGNQTQILSINPKDPGALNMLESSMPLSFSSYYLADINHDGIVDIADYNILLGCYKGNMLKKSCGSNKTVADLNQDGVVDEVDYNLFLRSFLSYLKQQP